MLHDIIWQITENNPKVSGQLYIFVMTHSGHVSRNPVVMTICVCLASLNNLHSLQMHTLWWKKSVCRYCDTNLNVGCGVASLPKVLTCSCKLKDMPRQVSSSVAGTGIKLSAGIHLLMSMWYLLWDGLCYRDLIAAYTTQSPASVDCNCGNGQPVLSSVTVKPTSIPYQVTRTTWQLWSSYKDYRTAMDRLTATATWHSYNFLVWASHPFIQACLMTQPAWLKIVIWLLNQNHMQVAWLCTHTPISTLRTMQLLLFIVAHTCYSLLLQQNLTQ